MKIRVGYELIYDFPQSTPMIMVLGTHFTRASDVITPDFLTTSPSVPIFPYRDVFGNWCSRLVAPAGRMRLSANGVVRDSGLPDVVVPSAVLLPGVDWDREIVRQIKQSSSVLFCISNRSFNKRGYIQKELRAALEVFQEVPSGQTYLIPVRLEECTVPEELLKYQFADIFREGVFDKLLKSIFIQWAKSRQRSLI
jgi:hypothetical protein